MRNLEVSVEKGDPSISNEWICTKSDNLCSNESETCRLREGVPGDLEEV